MAHDVPAEPEIALRPETDRDRAFLFELFAATRDEEFSHVDWNGAQKHAFLTMQFEARNRAYADQYPGASRHVVELHGRPVGRIFVDDQPEALRIVDIALLPEARNRGIGARLLSDFLNDADAKGKSVRLHVTPTNPARRLYERLGFEVEDASEMYVALVRRSPQEKTAS